MALVWALYALQWFWFRLLSRLVYKTLTGGPLNDNRSSDSEAKGE